MHALLYGFKQDGDSPWETTLLGVYATPADAEAAWEHFKKDLWAIFGTGRPEQDLLAHMVLAIEPGQNLWEPGQGPGTVVLKADLESIFG